MSVYDWRTLSMAMLLTRADKSLFERPPELYGKFGEAARRATRQDQYPETGRFGDFTGASQRASCRQPLALAGALGRAHKDAFGAV